MEGTILMNKSKKFYFHFIPVDVDPLSPPSQVKLMVAIQLSNFVPGRQPVQPVELSEKFEHCLASCLFALFFQ